MEEQTPQKEPKSSFRGLYKNVNISVKTLDKIIIGGIAVIILLLMFGIANNGYTVTFNSKGGTDVAAQECMYADLVAEPEPPTREGYDFSGWYYDENCLYLWDFETAQVGGDMILYAGWVKCE